MKRRAIARAMMLLAGRSALACFGVGGTRARALLLATTLLLRLVRSARTGCAACFRAFAALALAFAAFTLTVGVIARGLGSAFARARFCGRAFAGSAWARGGRFRA